MSLLLLFHGATNDVSVGLSGQSATISAGTITATQSAGIIGQASTLSAGTIKAAGDINVPGPTGPPSGISGGPVSAAAIGGGPPTQRLRALLRLGVVTPNVAVAISGTSASVAQGNLTPQQQAPISGDAISISIGTLTITVPDVHAQAGGKRRRGRREWDGEYGNNPIFPRRKNSTQGTSEEEIQEILAMVRPGVAMAGFDEDDDEEVLLWLV